MLLAEIGRVNEITVSPEELNRAMMQEAQRHQGQEKEVFEYYKNNPEAMQALESPVLEDKVVDFIVELADVTEKEVTIEELMQNPDGDAASDANQDKPKKKKAAKKKAVGKSKAKKGKVKRTLSTNQRMVDPFKKVAHQSGCVSVITKQM